MNQAHYSPLVVLMALVLVPVPAARADVLDNPQLENARALIEETQEALIRSDLRLTPEEDAAFWPLYESYRSATLPVRNRYVTLITNYLRRYDAGTLDDDYAAQMLRDYFDIRITLLETREGFIDRFATILPMLKVARFYQLENKLSADVEAELALIVPLVEDD